jgi:hypothetical protein
VNAHVDVNATRPGGFRPADQSQVVERGVHHLRDILHLPPLDAGHRIQIDAQLVGVIEIFRAHWMRMELDAREVGHPRERGRIAWHHFVGGAARRKFE